MQDKFKVDVHVTCQSQADFSMVFLSVIGRQVSSVKFSLPSRDVIDLLESQTLITLLEGWRFQTLSHHPASTLRQFSLFLAKDQC